jgi:hypothetical protein
MNVVYAVSYPLLILKMIFNRKFIEKAKKIHGDKYDSKVNYININTDVV